MEDQFILRPPRRIREKLLEDVKSGKLEKISIKMNSSREGVLTYEGCSYTGALIDTPTIIESHKTLDNKQFVKIADISKIMVFSEGDELQRAIKDAEISGITPPLAYVKNRRFRKRLTKAPIVEEIERAVTRLLNKDKEALRVDIQISKKDKEESEEEDVSSLAAEIEHNLMESEKDTPQMESLSEEEEDIEEMHNREELLKEIEEKIAEKEKQIKITTNPILRKRFQESLVQLNQEKEELWGALKKMKNNK
ncbi:transcription initiation factor TFIID subunit 7 [Nematocida sp. LUAm3]|nr:transcription initiation factor TFIID subunit 7 [Nematocida sp. LUAm3]KAI5173671.1 transcription initiation factor TFIID subunit 7 [Nematocida sp. LUAm2]KAI5176892.1 transcription initiation factor TFIID subunit 7 [Nematocida sp. LUAm1]